MSKLMPLHPIISNDYDSSVDLLMNGLADQDIRNVGVIAQYGAGKSSFLKTLQNKYNKKKVKYKNGKIKLNSLSISLANFNSRDERSPKISDEINDELEKSILQQMLYRKERSDLPHSHIKRVNNFIHSRFWRFLFLMLSCIICVAAFTLYGLNFNNINIFSFPFWDYVYPIVGAVFFLPALVLLILTVNFTKISIKDVEIEVQSKSESLLNKHLDEIIYFFQKTKYNTVIFEDLDRFNNLKIFVKLRELNNILNSNDKLIAKIGRIIFIYAIRDGVFEDAQDRIKFFDLVFPIFPVLSPLNRGDKIKTALQNSGFGKEWLTNSFINDISYYITDMRLLNNIVNDCISFSSMKEFNSLKEDSDKMRNIQLFSIMVYRNLHPNDFSQFEQGKGELAQLINQAEDFKASTIKTVNSEIGQLKERNRPLHSKASLAPDEQTILDKNLRKIKELYLQKSSIGGIITFIKNNANQFFQRCEVSNILKMLIINGYINDNFKNYIFRSGNSFLSENDETYGTILLERKPPIFDLKLQDVALIIQDMSADKFTSESALNFDAVNYLFNNQTTYKEQCDSMELLFKTESSVVKEFIFSFIEDLKDVDLNNCETVISKHFLIFIVTYLKDLFYLISKSTIEKEKIINFLLIVLMLCADNTILNQTYPEIFKTYLDSNDKLLKSIDKFELKLGFLKQHGLSIRELKKFNYNESVLSMILRNNFWDINFENVLFVLTQKFGYSESDVLTKGISLIKSLNDTNVTKYILTDQQKYITEVMLKADDLEINDAHLRNLLNDNNLNDEIKEAIIKKQRIRLTYASPLPTADIAKCLLKYNKIAISASSINNFISNFPKLRNEIAEYIIVNHEEYRDKFTFSSELSLAIVNSNKTINDKCAADYFISQIKVAPPQIESITNDDALTCILKNLNLTLTKAQIEHISKNYFDAAPKYLAVTHMAKILKKGLSNNRLEHLSILYSEDNEVKASIYKGSILDLTNDNITFAQVVLSDLIEKGFEITDTIYDSLTEFNIDKKALFLSQINYMTPEKLLSRLQNIEPKYFELINEGSIEIDCEELSDPIYHALTEKNVVVTIPRRGKNKGKYWLKLNLGEKLSA